MSIEFPEEAREVSDQEDDADDNVSCGSCHIAVVINNPGLSCKMCLSKCSYDSPLLTSQGKPIPWSAHKRAPDNLSKCPKNRLCMICRNTYNNLGWHDLYGSIRVYLKALGTREGKERHPKFLKSRAQWIKDHNLNPDRSRLKDKKELLQVQTEIKSYNDEGARLKRPLREFVEVEHWDSVLDGEFDASKVVDKDCFGTTKKGIWKNVGREGVFTEEAFAESGARSETLESNNEGIFGAERLQLKQLQIRKELDAAEKKKQTHSVAALAAGSALDILNLLKTAGIALPEQDPKADASSSSKKEENVDDAEDSEDDSTSSGEATQDRAALSGRLNAGFGGTGGKAAVGGTGAKAAVGGTGSKAAVVVPGIQTAQGHHGVAANNQARSQQPVSGSARVKDKSAVSTKASSGNTQAHSAVHVDGRSQVLVDGVANAVEEAQQLLDEITQIVENDESLCLIDQTVVAKKRSAAIKVELKKKITSLRANIKATQRKIDAAVSSAKDLLRNKSLESKVAALHDQVEAISELLVALNSSQPVPEEFLEAMSKCETHHMTFNSEVKKYEFWMRSQHLALYQQLEQWAKIFARDSDVSKKLQAAGFSQNDVSDVANSVAVNTLLSMLDDSKLEKNITGKSASKDAVIEFLREAQKLTESLLTADTLQGYKEWLAVMDLANSSGRQLKALLDKYSFVLESGSAEAADTSCLTIPLEQRLAVSHTGRQLLVAAKKHFDQVSEEFEIEEMVNDHAHLVGDFVKIHSVIEGEKVDMETFEGLWDQVEQAEELALKALEAKQPTIKSKSLKSLYTKLSENRSSVFDCVVSAHKNVGKRMVFAALRQIQETLADENVDAEETQSAIIPSENYWHLYRQALDEVNCQQYLEKQLFEQVLNQLPARKKMHAELQAFRKLANDLYDVLLCIVCTSNSSIQALHPDRTWTAEARDQLSSFDCKRLLSADSSQQDVEALQMLIQRITPSALEKSLGVYRTVRALLSLFTVGQGETVDRKQISAVGQKLDGLLPSNEATDCDLTVFLRFAKKILITLSKSAALGEDGRDDFSVFAQVQKSLAELIAQWPSTPIEDIGSSGFSDEKNVCFVKDEEKRVTTILLRIYQEKKNIETHSATRSGVCGRFDRSDR